LDLLFSMTDGITCMRDTTIDERGGTNKNKAPGVRYMWTCGSVVLTRGGVGGMGTRWHGAVNPREEMGKEGR
jgi:hypothetical protein